VADNQQRKPSKAALKAACLLKTLLSSEGETGEEAEEGKKKEKRNLLCILKRNSEK